MILIRLRMGMKLMMRIRLHRRSLRVGAVELRMAGTSLRLEAAGTACGETPQLPTGCVAPGLTVGGGWVGVGEWSWSPCRIMSGCVTC
jgi:hypothetical protein